MRPRRPRIATGRPIRGGRGRSGLAHGAVAESRSTAADRAVACAAGCDRRAAGDGSPAPTPRPPGPRPGPPRPRRPGRRRLTDAPRRGRPACRRLKTKRAAAAAAWPSIALLQPATRWRGAAGGDSSSEEDDTPPSPLPPARPARAAEGPKSSTTPRRRQKQARVSTDGPLRAILQRDGAAPEASWPRREALDALKETDIGLLPNGRGRTCPLSTRREADLRVVL